MLLCKAFLRFGLPGNGYQQRFAKIDRHKHKQAIRNSYQENKHNGIIKPAHDYFLNKDSQLILRQYVLWIKRL
jgi:hypothetical protein